VDSEVPRDEQPGGKIRARESSVGYKGGIGHQ
jgi:hypothetical protein